MRSSPSLSSPVALLVAAIVAIPPVADAQEDALELAGNWPYGSSSSVAVDEVRDLVYLASGGAVLVLDASDVTAPTLIHDEIRTDGLILDMDYSSASERLYLACNEAGLEVWDVSDPMVPARLSRSEIYYFDVETPVESVRVDEPFCFVECQWGYVHSLDVSDPADPVQLSFNGTMGNPARRMQVDPVAGYVHATGPAGYVRLDPDAAGSLFSAGSRDFSGGGAAVFGTPDVAYVGLGGQLALIDLNSVTFELFSILPVGGITDLIVRDGYAYLINDDFGLRIVDVSNPSSPVIVSTLDDDTPVFTDIRVAGDHAYLSARTEGLRIVDVSDPASPEVVGAYADVYSLSWDVEIVGDHALVANVLEGLVILDLGDRTSPDVVGEADTPASAYDLAVAGSIVYVADDEGGVRVVDWSDPTAPAEIAAAEGFRAWRVAVSGDLLYVIEVVPNQPYALRVFDVGDPAAPVEVGAPLELPTLSGEITLHGDVAYVSAREALVILDLSTPTAPVEVDRIPFDGVNDAEVAGDVLYLTSSDPFTGGLFAYDVSSPTSPVLLGSYQEFGLGLSEMEIQGEYVIASSGEEIHLFSVDTPSAPTPVDETRLSQLPFGLTVDGAFAVVANGEVGIQILRNTLVATVGVDAPAAGPAALAAPVASPSPFRGSTSIGYVVPEAGRVVVSVYAVGGERVRTLVSGSRPRGAARTSWDGRDDAGHAVAAGVYFVRVETGGRAATSRLLRLE